MKFTNISAFFIINFSLSEMTINLFTKYFTLILTGVFFMGIGLLVYTLFSMNANNVSKQVVTEGQGQGQVYLSSGSDECCCGGECSCCSGHNVVHLPEATTFSSRGTGTNLREILRADVPLA